MSCKTVEDAVRGIPVGALGVRFVAQLDELASVFGAPAALAEVNAADCDLVFVHGEHHPIEDFAVDPVSGAFLSERASAKKSLALLCYWRAAVLAAKDTNGSASSAGRKVTGLSNREKWLNASGWKDTWVLEDRLKDVGVDYAKGLLPLRPYVAADENRYAGQKPQSSKHRAERLVTNLG